MNKVTPFLGVFCFSIAATLRAQEAVRPSLARQYLRTTIPTIYNLKAGPVLFRVDASLRTEFVDNINLANGRDTPRESDLLITPQVGLDVSWTLSQLNTLRFHTTLGYTKYLSHSELDTSSVLLSPDSELSLNLYSGDFKFNFHDQFSYQQDPVGQGALSNVSRFGRFINIAGVEVLWDLNDVLATVGYDHTNFITTGATTSSGVTEDTSALDHTIDQISASALFRFTSTLRAGLEGTASSVRYSTDSRNDSNRVSVGPFLETQLTRFTTVAASVGYQGTFFTNNGGSSQNGFLTSSGNGSSNGNSYYANLTVTTRINRYANAQLSVGHESQVGLLSQQTQTNYVNLAGSYLIAPQLTVNSTFSFADTEDSGSLTSFEGTTASSHFHLYNFTIGTSYQITKKLNASLGYQFSMRTASSHEGVSAQNQDYTQNRIVLVLGYQF